MLVVIMQLDAFQSIAKVSIILYIEYYINNFSAF